jgi:hypothetical protein
MVPLNEGPDVGTGRSATSFSSVVIFDKEVGSNIEKSNRGTYVIASPERPNRSGAKRILFCGVWVWFLVISVGQVACKSSVKGNVVGFGIKTGIPIGEVRSGWPKGPAQIHHDDICPIFDLFTVPGRLDWAQGEHKYQKQIEAFSEEMMRDVGVVE